MSPIKIPIKKPPSWTTRYRLGVALNKELEPVCTLEELGAELGITKQNAYTESVLALGSFAYELHLRYINPHLETAS